MVCLIANCVFYSMCFFSDWICCHFFAGQDVLIIKEFDPMFQLCYDFDLREHGLDPFICWIFLQGLVLTSPR